MTEWKPVIGLEIHVHLKTQTKMFCRCELEYFAEPNTRTCPVCLAHPGALPVANRLAVEWTIKLGLALGCEIAEEAVFSRKNYFYPDNPKGYQISQYDQPLCVDGSLLVPGPEGDREIGFVRAHLEEDAAKTIHVGGATGRKVGSGYSLIDFNRGGTPLVEIVTQPDIRSAEEAVRFLRLLRQTIVELGISDAEMEKGTLRVDANVSVRPAGSDELRTRWELKNMNSFTFIGRGIDAAVRDQIVAYDQGSPVEQHTYDYEPHSDRLTPHRTKEEADDYRYFPEPDLVPVQPESAVVDRLRREIPELPGARIVRLREELGAATAQTLVTGGLDALWVATRDAGAEAMPAANVIANQLVGAGVDPDRVSPAELAKLVAAREEIPRKTFGEAIAHAGDDGFRADPYLEQKAVADTSELEPIVDEVLASNAANVEAYRSGKSGLLGFFVGQVMKATNGQADARVVNDLVRKKLEA
ncbi:MAG TPA: Asp-tRNA(Asn)/Glu-tRNA(Gln) amidotransferase subunit GatB [Gaiellaceae bacterium]